MPRKPLPVGAHGDIRLYGYLDGEWKAKADIPKGARLNRWRAIANYRGHDGRTRQVERGGTSIANATERLREDLADKAAVRATLSETSRVSDAVPAYLERITTECAPTTRDRYVSALNSHVLPGIGGLQFNECTVARLQRFEAGLVSHHVGVGKRKKRPKLAPNSRRNVREVVRGLMQVAVEDSALEHNPVNSMRKIKGGSQHPARATAAPDVAVFFAKLDADKWSRRADLPDIIRMLFGTGCRIGEAMALSWTYINLTDKPIRRDGFNHEGRRVTKTIPPKMMWINATISEPTGQGTVRSPVKSKRSNRIIGIPDFIYLMLVMRRPGDATGDDAVFPNGGTRAWRSPHGVRRAIAKMRVRLDEEFRSHGGRKTAATALYNAKIDGRDMADQFGHANSDFTRTNYVDEGLANPQAAIILDRVLSGAAEAAV